MRYICLQVDSLEVREASVHQQRGAGVRRGGAAVRRRARRRARPHARAGRARPARARARRARARPARRRRRRGPGRRAAAHMGGYHSYSSTY